MAGPLITVDVRGDEVLVALAKLPKKVRNAISFKLDLVLSGMREDIFEGLPGKYLDPATIHSGVTEQGRTIIGFIESDDKVGVYPITTSKFKHLRFIAKDGDLVRTRLVMHPYLKGSSLLARKMAELKPWIEDQLEDALIEAL